MTINTHQPSRSLLQRALPIALLVFASSSLYAEKAISVSLNGGAEVPPVSTSAKATGEITVQPDHTVSGSLKYSGMTPTMAHIHEGAIGKNGPPIITLKKSGNDGFTVPPDAKLTDPQYASYLAGNLYLNVHSAQHPDGEVRGQLPRP